MRHLNPEKQGHNHKPTLPQRFPTSSEEGVCLYYSEFGGAVSAGLNRQKSTGHRVFLL
jgi:hypothetical protein